MSCSRKCEYQSATTGELHFTVILPFRPTSRPCCSENSVLPQFIPDLHRARGPRNRSNLCFRSCLLRTSVAIHFLRSPGIDVANPIKKEARLLESRAWNYHL